MNSCCSAWTPESGCSHWGPEVKPTTGNGFGDPEENYWKRVDEQLKAKNREQAGRYRDRS